MDAQAVDKAASKRSSQMFTMHIKKFCELAGRNSRLVRDKVALDMFKSLIQKTPVLTGRAKGNWILTSGSIDPSYDKDKFDKDGGRTFAEGQRSALRASPSESIFLTNSIPYIVRLEYGWSPKAPYGMVRPTLKTFRQAVKRVADEMRKERSGL